MSEPPRQEPRDYRPTVFLPKTDFPMKAGLPDKEPGIAARWEAEGLYQQVRASRAGRTCAMRSDSILERKQNIDV